MTPICFSQDEPKAHKEVENMKYVRQKLTIRELE